MRLFGFLLTARMPSLTVHAFVQRRAETTSCPVTTTSAFTGLCGATAGNTVPTAQTSGTAVPCAHTRLHTCVRPDMYRRVLSAVSLSNRTGSVLTVFRTAAEYQVCADEWTHQLSVLTCAQLGLG